MDKTLNLGINCVQACALYVRKTMDNLPQVRDLYTAARQVENFYPQYPQLGAMLSPTSTHCQSTERSIQVPLLKRYLSAVSTPLTITTTIYI